MPVRHRIKLSDRLAQSSRRLPALLLLLLAFALLGGCPKRSGNANDPGAGTADNPGAGKGGLKGGLSPSTITPPGGDPVTTPQTGANSGDGGAPTPGESATGQEVAAAPAGSELAGRWFALFGREGSGMAYYTYMDAKFISLDGQGRILIEDGSGPNAALPGRYALAAGKLRVWFADPRLGAEQLLAGSAGSPAAGGQSGMILAGSKPFSPDQLGLKMDADRQFLGLYDGRGKLTVYGRDDSPHVAGLPGLPGQWQLYFGPRGTYTSSLAVDGLQMDITWREGGGWWKGRFSHGYFVGQGQDAATAFAGALTQSEDGVLNGFYSPAPFVDVMPIFDLKRIPAG